MQGRLLGNFVISDSARCNLVSEIRVLLGDIKYVVGTLCTTFYVESMLTHFIYIWNFYNSRAFSSANLMAWISKPECGKKGIKKWIIHRDTYRKPGVILSIYSAWVSLTTGTTKNFIMVMAYIVRWMLGPLVSVGRFWGE